MCLISLITFVVSGQDPSKVWEQANEAIRSVYLSKESALIEAASQYKSTRNFFEMVRFDLVIDEDLNVYVMEVRSEFSGNITLSFVFF